MRKFSILILIFTITFFSCGDGDILDFELDFDQELSLCGDVNSDSYLVYDIKLDPEQSIVLLIPGTDTNDLIFFPEETPYNEELTINGSSIRANYREYNGDPTDYICQYIPSSDVEVTTNYEAQTGTIESESTFVDEEGVRTVIVSFTIVNTDIEVFTADTVTIGTYTHSYSIED